MHQAHPTGILTECSLLPRHGGCDAAVTTAIATAAVCCFLRVPAKQQLHTPSLVHVRVLCCCSVVNVIGATNSHTKRVKLGEACDVTNDCTLYPGCTVGKGAVLGERCRVFGEASLSLSTVDRPTDSVYSATETTASLSTDRAHCGSSFGSSFRSTATLAAPCAVGLLLPVLQASSHTAPLTVTLRTTASHSGTSSCAAASQKLTSSLVSVLASWSLLPPG